MVSVQVVGASISRQLSYVVVGRNDGTHGSVMTDTSGLAQISYRDHPAGSTGTSDTIAVIDPTDDLSATGTVDYLDGPDNAEDVALDLSGSGFDDASCGVGKATPAASVELARETVICAAIVNSLGEPLAGKALTFAVSPGSVAAMDGSLPTGESTLQTTTDRTGTAFAVVTSTTSGRQAITVTADRLTRSGSITYASPTPDQAAAIRLLAPVSRLVAGRARRFVATVADTYGNPVAGVEVGVVQHGAGALVEPTASSTTGSDGSIIVFVATRRGETGPGTVTATITSAPTQCGAAGSCSAMASYLVSRPVVAASLTLEAAPGAAAGDIELVAAVVRGVDGSPVPGQIVHFAVSGADSASGAVRSNSRGVALFGYPAQRRGRDTIHAWDDTNRDGRHQRAEPDGALVVRVAAQGRSKHAKK